MSFQPTCSFTRIRLETAKLCYATLLESSNVLQSWWQTILLFETWVRIFLLLWYFLVFLNITYFFDYLTNENKIHNVLIHALDAFSQTHFSSRNNPYWAFVYRDDCQTVIYMTHPGFRSATCPLCRLSFNLNQFFFTVSSTNIHVHSNPGLLWSWSGRFINHRKENF